MKSIIRAIIALWIIAVLTSCGGGGGGEEETSTTAEISSVQLISGSAKLQVGKENTTKLTATVTNGEGAPVSGVAVNFITSVKNVLSSDSDTTDSNGIASVTFKSPNTPGTIKIKAEAGGIYSDEISIEITPGLPDKFSVEVSPDPPILTTSETANFTITVRDQYGNLVSDDTYITFDPSQLNYGTLTYESNKTQNGQISVTYIPKGVPGVDTFYATYGSVKSEPISVTVANFVGSVFDENGNPIEGADVYVYSPKYTTQTDSSGIFKLYVTPPDKGEEKHTIMIESEGKICFFHEVKITYENKVKMDEKEFQELPIMLQDSNASPYYIKASTPGSTITSNQIGSYTATLYIPTQEKGFYINGSQKNGEYIRLEILNIKSFLPVPLPRSSEGYKKAPYFLVAISPYTLTFTTNATLTIPAISGAQGLTLYHYDMESHEWKDTGYTVSSTNTTSVSINEAGIYGVFHEDKQIGAVSGSSPSGSLVFIGDQIIKVGSDGSFIAEEVPVATSDDPLIVIILDKENKKKLEKKVTPKVDTLVYMVAGFTTDIDQIVITPVSTKVTTSGTDDTSKTELVIEITDASGLPLSNKVISLSSTLGSLEDTNGNPVSTVTTDSQGKATVIFEAGTNPGTAKITAESEGKTGETQIEVIKIGAVTLSADKQFLLKNESVLLRGQVTDVYGSPASGIKVKMSSSNLDILSLGVSLITTDNNGQYTVTATAGEPSQNMEVTLTAQSGDKTSETKLSVVVPKTITVDASPTTINTGGETATITAHVTDSDGKAVSQIPVTFNSTFCDITPTTAATDYNGIAISYLISGDDEGKATITAKAGDLESTATVNIIQSEVTNVPQVIEVENIETTGIYVKGSGNKETSSITFKVLDGNGNPVSNVQIQFSLVGGSQGGEYLVPTNGITDSDGTVTTTLKAGTKPGVVKIKAWYTDEVITETGNITIHSGPPEGKHLSMAVEKLNIHGLIKDGLEDTISIRLADLYSNPVPEGTAIHFESEYAKMEGADTTTGSGTASAKLYSQDPRPTKGLPIHIWSQTQSGTWGHISTLYIDNSKMYVATDGGGLFKSTDNGDNWENIGIPRSYSEGLKGLWGTYINDMAVKDNLIVVATEDWGLLLSEDGGYNWKDLRSMSDRWKDTIEIEEDSSCSPLTYYPINLRERIDLGGNISWNISERELCARTKGNYEIEYDIFYNSPSAPAKLLDIYDENRFFVYFSGNGIWEFRKDKMHFFEFNRSLPYNFFTTLCLCDTNGDTVKDYLFVTTDGKIYGSPIEGVSLSETFKISQNTAIYSVTQDDIKVTKTHLVSQAESGSATLTINLDTSAETSRKPDILYNGSSYTGSWFYEADNKLTLVLSEDNKFSAGDELIIYYYRKDVTLNISLDPPADTSNTTVTLYRNGIEYTGYSITYAADGSSVNIKFDKNNLEINDLLLLYYPQKVGRYYFQTDYPIKSISNITLNGNPIDTNNAQIVGTKRIKIKYNYFKTDDNVTINYIADISNFSLKKGNTGVSFNDAYTFGTYIYYATTNGVKRFNTSSNSLSDISIDGCPTNDIKRIVVADSNTIYIGTDLGIYRVEIDEGKAYPLNVFKERYVTASETKELTLTYASDQDKTHTTIYVNGVEIPASYYDFEDNKTIKIRDEVDPIGANSTIEIYYTLETPAGYDIAPQKKITSIYFYNDTLYFGTEERKLYSIENPSDASKNDELPKISDISGLTQKISLALYKTTEIMFSGNTQIQAFWDSDNDGYFDNGSISIPDGGSINILVIVSDQNGRPLVSGSQISISTDVGALSGATSSTLPDSLYGGEGITEFWITLYDNNSGDTDPAKSGQITIDVKSDNGNETLSIPVVVD